MPSFHHPWASIPDKPDKRLLSYIQIELQNRPDELTESPKIRSVYKYYMSINNSMTILLREPLGLLGKIELGTECFNHVCLQVTKDTGVVDPLSTIKLCPLSTFRTIIGIHLFMVMDFFFLNK